MSFNDIVTTCGLVSAGVISIEGNEKSTVISGCASSGLKVINIIWKTDQWKLFWKMTEVEQRNNMREMLQQHLISFKVPDLWSVETSNHQMRRTWFSGRKLLLFNYLLETFIFFLLGLRNSSILFIISSKLQNRARGRLTSQNPTVGTWLRKVDSCPILANKISQELSPKPRVLFLVTTGNHCDRGEMGHTKASELGNERTNRKKFVFMTPAESRPKMQLMSAKMESGHHKPMLV